ncbi:MAG: hypothetical protein OEV64_03625 [Desulfobulbaceae bacterium]|nr:hypothetical protein [Desulfobulbaceae bacterium]
MSTASMNDPEKLRVILPHWIAHNKGHWEEFEKWASLLEASGRSQLSDELRSAVTALREAQVHLEASLEILGGPSEHNNNHHHHHHH